MRWSSSLTMGKTPMKSTSRIVTMTIAGALAFGWLGISRAVAQWAGGYNVVTSGPGYAYAYGRLPGYGSYYRSTVRSAGVTTSVNVGVPPLVFVGPGMVLRGPSPSVSVVGPNYAWGRVPGYGDYFRSTTSGGGVTSSVSVGVPPVSFIGPGFGYGRPMVRRRR